MKEGGAPHGCAPYASDTAIPYVGMSFSTAAIAFGSVIIA